MKCPNCHETLLMSQRNQVEIDYCPNCRGVWLDRGELDKILQAEQVYERPDSHGYDHTGWDRKDAYQQQSGYQKYPRKKKSFLGDFFDFD